VAVLTLKLGRKVDYHSVPAVASGKHGANRHDEEERRGWCRQECAFPFHWAGGEQATEQLAFCLQYITRNQAIKKLQCTLSDFRRLCILKGARP